MTTLANGIDLPLVVGMGLGAFGFLTLFVTTIETLVLRWMLRVPFGVTFWRVLLANLVSTAAGCVVHVVDDPLLRAWGIRTMFDYAHYYVWGALGLIVLYYAESVLLEGWVICTRRFAQRVGLARRRLWVGVLVANAATYLILSPVFYFVTRPTFGNVHVAKYPTDVATCQDPVYYIDPNRHVCMIHADGTGQRVLVGQPVRRFLLSADGTMFLCLGADGNLWAQPRDSGASIALRGRSFTLDLDSADLSAGCDKVAFLAPADASAPADDSLRGEAIWALHVFDLRHQALMAETVVTTHAESDPKVAWDAADPDVVWCGQQDDALVPFRLTNAGLVCLERTGPPYPVRNLRPYAPWDRPRPTDVQGDLRLQVFPWSGGSFRVTRSENEEIMDFRHHYGMLWAGLSGPGGGAFLSAPGQIVFQTRELVCVGNVARRTIAILVEGDYCRLGPRSPIDPPLTSDPPASAPASAPSDPQGS